MSNEGMWWSPTAKYLAYVQINDTEVQAIEYTMYGSGQYPTTMIVPYPKVQKHSFSVLPILWSSCNLMCFFCKAGSNLPKAKLFVIDVSTATVHSEVVVPKSVRAGYGRISSSLFILT